MAADHRTLAVRPLGGIAVARRRRRNPVHNEAMRLHPTDAAPGALAQVLAHQLATMRGLETPVRTEADPEVLHDFRVAVRRTRSVLSLARKHLPHDITRWKAEWTWLATLTSDARDLDVLLADIEGARATLPGDAKSGLDELAEIVTARRREAQQQLCAALDSDRYRSLTEEWRAALGELALTPRGDDTDTADAVARALVHRATEKVSRRASRIDAQSPVSSVHDLRKRIKRLRYVLELFREVLPERTVKGIVKETKRLQDELGAFQDNEVRGHLLDDTMAAAGSLSGEGAKAGRLLLDQYEARRTTERQALTKHVRRFAKTAPQLT